MNEPSFFNLIHAWNSIYVFISIFVTCERCGQTIFFLEVAVIHKEPRDVKFRFIFLGVCKQDWSWSFLFIWSWEVPTGNNVPNTQALLTSVCLYWMKSKRAFWLSYFRSVERYWKWPFACSVVILIGHKVLFVVLFPFVLYCSTTHRQPIWNRINCVCVYVRSRDISFIMLGFTFKRDSVYSVKAVETGRPGCLRIWWQPPTPVVLSSTTWCRSKHGKVLPVLNWFPITFIGCPWIPAL